jgi:hypothetical protein
MKTRATIAKIAVVGGLIAIELAFFSSVAVWRVWLVSQLKQETSLIQSEGLPLTSKQVDDWYAIPDDENFADSLESALPLLDLGTDEIDEEMVRLINTEPLAELPVESLGAVREYISRNQLFLQQVEAALETGTQARYDVDLTAGVSADLQHAAVLRSITRLLAADAMIEASDGHGRNAALRLDQCLLLAQTLERVPNLLSQLVRIALIGIWYEAFEYVSSESVFEESSIQNSHDLIEAAIEFEGIRIGLVGERANAASLIDEVVTSKPVKVSVRWYYDLEKLRTFWSFRELLNISTDRGSERYNRLLSWQARWSGENGNKTILHSILVPSLTRAVDAESRCRAQLALARAAMGLIKFRQEGGDLRTFSKWEQVIPEFVPSTPIDSFNGQPLRFRFDGQSNRLLLYAVGHDRDDDGGIRPNEKNGLLEDGDLVFVVSASRI